MLSAGTSTESAGGHQALMRWINTVLAIHLICYLTMGLLFGTYIYSTLTDIAHSHHGFGNVSFGEQILILIDGIGVKTFHKTRPVFTRQ